ncbi:APH(3') family aminoglycoside O-phosphotransferase [Natronospora cellulosivora (SeqCode)]
MENILLEDIPDDLNNIICDSSFQENTTGCSNSTVLHINKIKQYNSAYLKVAVYNKVENLKNEVEILKWLKGRVSVPEVYYYKEYKDKEYILMSEIKGFECSNQYYRKEPEKMVKIFAEGLKEIHKIDISECPFDQTLEKKIKKAKYNVDNGLVDEEDVQAENIGKNAKELYEMLVDRRPESEDLVFTHGDYCLPNVIINENKLSGFIDMGRAGVADRYQDLALAVRTLKSNLGSIKWSELFLKYYGLEKADYSKIDFYILLDELF